jgi:peroxiredoxin
MLVSFLLSALIIGATQEANSAGPKIGATAPAFSNVDADGRTHAFDALKGKWIVLEWFNPSCPSTRQRYESGAIPRRQRDWTGKGLVWLSISTTARIERAAAFARSHGGAATAMLDDLDAKTAMPFQAKTTPHMFVIDPKGVVIYMGAFDDQPERARASTSDGRNFVDEALTSAMAGRPVGTPVTTAYGCSVQYQR